MIKFLEFLVGRSYPSANDLADNQIKERQAALIQEQATPPVEEFGLSSLPENSIAQIQVVLFRNNECQILVEIDDGVNSNDEAMAIGRMLYQLNEGEMKSTIAGIITRQSCQNVEDTEFGKAIMKSWESFYKESNDDCIKPSQVFGGDTR